MQKSKELPKSSMPSQRNKNIRYELIAANVDVLEIDIRRFFAWKQRTRHHKNTDGHPCRSVLRASQNQASTLDCRKEIFCSSPELVVWECGLMLDEMISVLWLDCHGFNVFCRIRSALKPPSAPERGNAGNLYTGIHWFLSAKAAFRPEYSRYTRQIRK